MKRTVARTKLPTAGRSVAEWIGATPDTAIPDRVKLRVFRRHGGICHITSRKISPADRWDADHVIALCNGGENREGNLAPALKDSINAHKAKTAADVAERAKVDARAKKHLGIKKRVAPAAQIRSAPMPTTPKAARRAERGRKQSLPPRIWRGFVPATER